MKAYSVDLRRKIVETYEAGGISQRELAKRFLVSLYFVVTLLRRWRTENTLEAKKRGATLKPRLRPEIMQFLAARLDEQCDLSLTELCECAAVRFGVSVSPKTMSRMLLREGWRRKKSVNTPLSGKVNGFRASEKSGVKLSSRI